MNSTSPLGPKVLNKTDLVISEISVLDMTADASSNVRYPGKFLGLAEKGTKNKSGEPTGLDYLLSLGITHVQLMPSFDFASIDEAAPEDVTSSEGISNLFHLPLAQ